MVAHKTKLLQLTKEKDCEGIKFILESLDYQVKGDIFEWYLAELYRGKGWLTNIQGGKHDFGADILLYHPKTPAKAAMVIQAKNHVKPLTFDQTKIELIKFEQKAARQYDCQQFQLIALNGFVAEASKLGEFNMLLSGWRHIADLIEDYNPDMKTEPEIELYAHNKSTYENVKRLWREGNYVAVVQATGTGKSMLIAKVMSDFLGQKTLVLAPSRYILDQQKGKVPWATQSTTFMTYAKVAHLKKQQIENLDIDLIVLDEFHRCGAEVWGAGVQRVLTAYGDSYVMGTTATPIRYLDDSRDMSDELFAGVVAADISLAEAIIRRILPVPTYVAALYTLVEEIEELRDKLFKSNFSEEKKKKIEGEINQLAINWEKTLGVPQILAKHLRPNINKLIVFCKDQNHLDEMEVEVQKWFQKAAIHRWRKVYRVISADPESDRNLENFKKSHAKDTVHLLFAIDMLNEGLHLPDVGAVILLRPTESPIVFYQQIGRCIQVGADQAPIIFDFVNNFSSIRAGDFLQDLEDAKNLEKAKRADLGLEVYAPTLQVIDETKEIIKVFDEIEDRLASWASMYERLLEFKRHHGHCNIPSRWPENLKLSRWVFTQREFWKNGKLSEDRINRLEAAGFEWNVLETNWNEMFSALMEFKEKSGHCNVPRSWPENPGLSYWVGTQRENYRKGLLSPDRIVRLEQIGLIWDTIQNSWEENYSALIEFKSATGNCNVPDKWPMNLKLSHWVGKQRSAWKKNRLSVDRIERLNTIGFIWDTQAAVWNKMFGMLQEFKKNSGHCNIPHKWSENIKLSRWVDRIRQLWKEGKLSPERIKQLESLGFTIIDHDAEKKETWEKMFSSLCEFKKIKGHCKVTQRWHKNPALANWVSNQRQMKRNNRLSSYYLRRLNEIGFIWHTREDLWEKRFSELLEFKKVCDHCMVPKDWSENPKIGTWVNNQRRNKKRGLLSTDRIGRLDEIGFLWDIIDSSWEGNYSNLLKYYKIYGHADVPIKWPENQQLGKWVSYQRSKRRINQLSESQIQRLENIKFNWKPKDKWNEMYANLLEFKNLYGNCNVPRGWQRNPELSNWVNRQRRQYKTGQLDEEQIKKLEDVGFLWDIRQNIWEKRFSELSLFKAKIGHCDVPDKWGENPKLSHWVGVQRRNYSKGKINRERITRLNEIGFVWEPIDATWSERFSELIKFKELNGHCHVPQRFADNPILGRWIARQRASIKRKQLSNERMRLLEEIGFE